MLQKSHTESENWTFICIRRNHEDVWVGPPTNMHVAGSTTSLLSVQIIFATFICAVPCCAFQTDALHSAFHLCHVCCYCVRVLLSLWSQHLSFCFTVLHSHKSSPLLLSLSLQRSVWFFVLGVHYGSFSVSLSLVCLAKKRKFFSADQGTESHKVIRV